MALVAVTSQNVAAGKELQVQSLAVTGGTIYVTTLRTGGMDLTAASMEFVPTFTAGTSSGARSISTLATAGAGTITGAILGAGIVKRTTAPSAFTDTTDTGANILVALPTFVQNSALAVDYVNTTNFQATIAAGANVTVTGATVAANSMARFLLTRTDANTGTPTWTLVQYADQPLSTAPELVTTTLATNGAGTITAAGIAGGVTLRTTASAAFTDTTDTAANIIAQLPNGNVGQSFIYTYVNNSSAVATIAGGASVTASGLLVVPQGMVLQALVTFNGAGTVTFVGLDVFQNGGLPNAQSVVKTSGTGTMAVGDASGACVCALAYTTQAAITITTRTGTQLQADLPNAIVGSNYELVISNQNTGLLTLTPAAGVTVSGPVSAAIQPGTWAAFVVTLTAANTWTWVNVATGQVGSLLAAKFTSINVTTGTLAAGNASGAAFVALLSTNATPGAQAMRTVAQVLTDTPGLVVGQAYVLRVVNTGAGTFTLATDGSTQFTMTGTMTVLTNTFRDFTVTINSATTGTVQTIGTGVAP